MAEPEQLLPPEMVKEILCRLPSKPLLRFLSVCKSWRSLITDPFFISLHRRHSPSFFLLEFLSNSPPPRPVHLSLHRNDPLFTPSNFSLRFPFPSPINKTSSIVSICHGLLCIGTFVPAESHIYFTICNPSIRRLLSLPKPQPLPHPLQDHPFAIALGFDSQNCDYKIVRIIFCIGRGYRISSFRVEVYSLASGLWRTLPLPPLLAPPFIISRPFAHGFVNGVVHWGATRIAGEEGYRHFVLSFDFVDEVFREVLLPPRLSRASFEKVSISVVGGSDKNALTVYHVDRNSPCTGAIWMMKEYGIVESWTKLFAFDFTGSRLEAGLTVIRMLPSALFVKNNGEILLPLYSSKQQNGHLCLLNVEKKRFVDLQIGPDDYAWRSLSVQYYSESLVLLNYADALASY